MNDETINKMSMTILEKYESKKERLSNVIKGVNDITETITLLLGDNSHLLHELLDKEAEMVSLEREVKQIKKTIEDCFN